MDLYTEYKDVEILKLIAILESSEDYTVECIEVICAILLERNFKMEDYKSEIIALNREKIQEKIENFNPLQEQMKLHKSLFLTQEELTELYKSELKHFIKYNKNHDYNDTF